MITRHNASLKELCEAMAQARVLDQERATLTLALLQRLAEDVAALQARVASLEQRDWP